MATSSVVSRAAAKTSSGIGGPAKRTSKTARRTTDSPNVPDEGPETTLRRDVQAIFADAQKSATGHRKLVAKLKKIQDACCYEFAAPKKAGSRPPTEDFDQDDFDREVVRCVLRVLPVKKSEAVGDRVVRFLGLFLRIASEKDNQLVEDQAASSDTPTAHLATAILGTLLQLSTTKDRIVRFRATQIVAHIVNTLDTLDDDMFHLLRLALLKRIHDKEAPVRMHAIYGLTRLAANSDDDQGDQDSDESDSVGSGVLEKLLVMLQHDPSAEVRRALLLNLPLAPSTLPFLLERARDQDVATRRALYARLLPTLGDFRHLSLTHREKLLRWGLRDRDETVRKATARLFRERWIEDCAALPAAAAASADDGDQSQQEAADGNKRAATATAAQPSLDALLELLERIDVINSGNAHGVALDAMQEFWQGRPDYRDHLSFDTEAFWQELSPEAVFIARTFNDHCRNKDVEEDGRLLDLLEAKMPEVTKFGFLLERQINLLVECIRQAATGGPNGEVDEELEEDGLQLEFVVEQMLHMALTFDYSDEVGRRKMFTLVREALAIPELPEEATKLSVELLRLVSGTDTAAKGESDFCGVVLEAIAEVHDTIMTDDGDAKTGDEDESESFHSARSELSSDGAGRKSKRKDADDDVDMDDDGDAAEEAKAIREIMVNMKCLHVAQCMLQNVQCELEQNVHLVTMLNNLVVPAVRSQEAPIRERGLVCLGLCCLLSKENLTLFLHCFAKGHAALQCIALQIITDILITHPSLLSPVVNPDQTSSGESDGEASPFLKPVLKAFAKSIKATDASVQSTGATALAKLMLSQLITDGDLLKAVVVAFFDPDTASNAELRQGLSYFLPVYCHSRAENARRMALVATSVISRLATLREAMIEDEDVEEGDMVTLTVVGGLLVDWTDPRKAVGNNQDVGQVMAGTGQDVNGTHLVLAEQILEKLVTTQTSKDERKVLFAMLGKLHFGVESPDAELLRTVLELVTEAMESNVASDATGRNTLSKLQTALLKLMHDVAGAERGAGQDGDDEAEDQTAVQTATDVAREGEESVLDDAGQEEDVTAQLQRELESSHLSAVPSEEETRAALEDLSDFSD